MTSEAQINVAQLLKEGPGATRVIDVEDTVPEDNGPLKVRGKITLTVIDKRILVQGRLETNAELVCSRCLKRFRCPLSLDIEEEYYPSIDVNTGIKLETPEDPGSFTIDEHHVLDLTEAIRQYKLMALPMKPLCSEECAGICPTCGQDLNEGTCHCVVQSKDPRWGELLKMTGQDAEATKSGHNGHKGRK